MKIASRSVWILVLTVFSVASVFPQTLSPVYQAKFNEGSFAETGWGVIPSGSGEFTPAPVNVGLIPASPQDSTLSDGRGIFINAVSGQGSLVYGPVIPAGNDPVLMRVSILAQSAGASIAVGALDVQPEGNIGTVDGSVTYSIESNSSRFVGDYQRVTVIYYPKSKAIIPLFQVAVFPSPPNQAVSVMVDNFEVYSLNQQSVTDPVLRTLFGISSSGAQPTPTPTTTATPTPTPPPTSGDTISVLDLFEISPTNDDRGVKQAAVAYDRSDVYAVAAADESLGYPDILLRTVDADPLTIEAPITVNQTFDDTVTIDPDIDVDFSGVRHVAWSDNRSIEKLFSIYLAPYDSFGNRKRANDLEVNILYEDTDAHSPALDVRNDGRMAVAWTDNRNFVDDVFVRRLRWTGSNLQALDEDDFQINVPYENTTATSPDVVLDENGTIAAVWSDNRIIIGGKKRNDIYARIFNLNTQPGTNGQLANTVPEIAVSLEDSGSDNARNPAIAHTNGRFVVVWENHSAVTPTTPFSINAAVFNSSGAIVEPEFYVSDENSTDEFLHASISNLKDNQFIISWYAVEDDTIYARVYDAQQHLFLSEPTPLAEGLFSPEFTGIAGNRGSSFLSIFNSNAGVSNDLYGLYGSFVSSLTAGKVSKPLSAAKKGLQPFSNIKPREENGRLSPKSKERKEGVVYSNAR